jgi:hypothetical protein
MLFSDFCLSDYHALYISQALSSFIRSIDFEFQLQGYSLIRVIQSSSRIITGIFFIGCLIDFDRREVIFSLNGHSLDPFRKLFASTTDSITAGYFAAASFMSYQHCRFNFGAIPFRYPPTTVQSFKTFNEYGDLSDNDKLILPKYKKLELLRSTKISDLDCILCADLRANISLKPCQHTGFCEQCAYKLEICPICRSDIRERVIIITS